MNELPQSTTEQAWREQSWQSFEFTQFVNDEVGKDLKEKTNLKK